MNKEKKLSRELGAVTELDLEKFEKLCERIEKLSFCITKHLSGEMNQSFNSIQFSYLIALDINTKIKKSDYLRYVSFHRSITRILAELGIHKNNKGYIYIIEAVKILIDLHTINIVLNKDVYPCIAENYNVDSHTTIEHSIRNAIGAACRDYQNDRSANKMGIFKIRPSNKAFLFYVCEVVMYDMINSRLCTE